MRIFLHIILLVTFVTMSVYANAQEDNYASSIRNNPDTSQEFMGYMSYPDAGGVSLPDGADDICIVAPLANGPFFYDVAYDATERELKGTDYKHLPKNEEAIAFAREFFDAAKIYDSAVNTCMQEKDADINYCKCRQDEERLSVQHLYGVALETFPQWERMILKIPRRDRGHQFLEINRFAPDSWAYYCGNQIE